MGSTAKKAKIIVIFLPIDNLFIPQSIFTCIFNYIKFAHH
jgi:hypothetical protein